MTSNDMSEQTKKDMTEQTLPGDPTLVSSEQELEDLIRLGEDSSHKYSV